MRASPLLALMLLSVPSSRAEEGASSPQGQAVAEPRQAAPQLLHLEQTLMRRQEARDKGELPPEKYQEFVAAFRVELEAVMGRIPPTPENAGLHAQILARLGPQEQAQALASLEEALAQDPGSAALLVAKGSILYEQGDSQAAAALAAQAYEASGRKDERAWALLKMSEGRISGVQSGEPGQRLKPASDFARPEWSIPQRHDVNEQGLDYLRKATKAFRAGDIDAARMHTQAAMNADPTSRSLQDAYQRAQASFAKRDEIKGFLDQAVVAKNAGRHQDALAWIQKAYDAFPNDRFYEALQVARQRAAEDSAKHVAEPLKPPVRGGSGPLLPILLITGTGLFAYGGYQLAKSKGTRTSDDGVDPSPQVAPDQARRNYLTTAAVAGAVLVALASWEFGPGVLAAGRAFLSTSGPSGATLVPAGAGSGATLGGTTLGTTEAGLIAGGAYLGAKTLSQSEARSDLPGYSFAKSADDENSRLRGRDSKRQHDRSGKLKDKDFRRWFHRNWKRPGDTDASDEVLEEAYEEWLRQGRPSP